MKKSNLALVLTLMLSYSAFGASGDRGHGGDVLVCPNKPIITMDQYEATFIRDGKSPTLFDVEALNPKYKTINSFVDARLSKYPKFLNELKEAISTFNSRTKVEHKLLPKEDSNISFNHDPENEGCEVRRAYERKLNEVWFDSSVTKISQSTFSKKQHELLLVHEYFGEIGVKYGHFNTAPVRALIRVVLDTESNDSNFRVAIANLTSDAFLAESQNVYLQAERVVKEIYGNGTRVVFEPGLDEIELGKSISKLLTVTNNIRRDFPTKRLSFYESTVAFKGKWALSTFYSPNGLPEGFDKLKLYQLMINKLVDKDLFDYEEDKWKDSSAADIPEILNYVSNTLSCKNLVRSSVYASHVKAYRAIGAVPREGLNAKGETVVIFNGDQSRLIDLETFKEDGKIITKVYYDDESENGQYSFGIDIDDNLMVKLANDKGTLISIIKCSKTN